MTRSDWKKVKKVVGWRRTDSLWYGSVLIYLPLIILADRLKINTLVLAILWLSMMTVVIVPVRLFPNTKWAIWWNK